MLIELIICLLFGIIIGTLTGLIPGIHINLVAFFLLTISPTLLLIFPPISLVIFIISLSITHIFIDFIPSIFLGAPNEDTVLSILPGHELLLNGSGYEAVILSIFGGIIGILLLIPISSIFIIILPIIYIYLTRIIAIILIIIIIFMIFSETNKFKTILIIILAGFLGIASLNLNLKDPLLPLLTGLFGSSSLITSISKKQIIPKQEIRKIKEILTLNPKSINKSIFSSLIASPICSFLPGLGSSQAATIGSYIFGDLDKKEFLILIGIVNTLVMSLSFITLFSINKSRTGSAAAISQLIPNFSLSNLILIISIIIIVSFISFLITIKIAKIFSKKISLISYNKLSTIILIFLSIIILIFSSPLGFLVYVISTFLGISCILLNVKRTSLMSCLIMPTILFYIV